MKTPLLVASLLFLGLSGCNPLFFTPPPTVVPASPPSRLGTQTLLPCMNTPPPAGVSVVPFGCSGTDTGWDDAMMADVDETYGSFHHSLQWLTTLEASYAGKLIEQQKELDSNAPVPTIETE